MKTLLVTMDYNASVVEAAKVMKKKDVGSILVSDGKKIGAIVTDEDIVRKAVATGDIDVKVRKIATKPLITIHPGADLVEAARQMAKKNVRRLVVLDSADRVVGMISQTDIMKLSPSLYDLIAEREHVHEEQEPS